MCLHDDVSKMCRLEFRFQNLPLSKSAGKNVPFSCEREADPSDFSPFSNVPASCERSQSFLRASHSKEFKDILHDLFQIFAKDRCP